MPPSITQVVDGGFSFFAPISAHPACPVRQGGYDALIIVSFSFQDAPKKPLKNDEVCAKGEYWSEPYSFVRREKRGAMSANIAFFRGFL